LRGGTHGFCRIGENPEPPGVGGPLSEKNGRRLECFDSYPCFGFFRLAVIAQQIYYRYYHGQARDERFKMLLVAVRVLEEAALRVMKESVK
jgi:hypothetical protein